MNPSVLVGGPPIFLWLICSPPSITISHLFLLLNRMLEALLPISQSLETFHLLSGSHGGMALGFFLKKNLSVSCEEWQWAESLEPQHLRIDWSIWTQSAASQWLHRATWTFPVVSLPLEPCEQLHCTWQQFLPNLPSFTGVRLLCLFLYPLPFIFPRHYAQQVSLFLTPSWCLLPGDANWHILPPPHTPTYLYLFSHSHS